MAKRRPVRQRAINIGGGMMLTQADVEKAACFFNRSMIEDAISKPSMASKPSKSE